MFISTSWALSWKNIPSIFCNRYYDVCVCTGPYVYQPQEQSIKHLFKEAVSVGLQAHGPLSENGVSCLRIQWRNKPLGKKGMRYPGYHPSYRWQVWMLVRLSSAPPITVRVVLFVWFELTHPREVNHHCKWILSSRLEHPIMKHFHPWWKWFIPVWPHPHPPGSVVDWWLCRGQNVM